MRTCICASNYNTSIAEENFFTLGQHVAKYASDLQHIPLQLTVDWISVWFLWFVFGAAVSKYGRGSATWSP